METIYTIPINEAFEASVNDPECGCPFCSLARMLEENELDRILGAAMMEPDIRIMTNEEGFCRTHYDMMFVRKNRLGMALTLESHLHELQKDLKDTPIINFIPGQKQIKRIEKLEKSCFVCRNIEYHFAHMMQNTLEMWESHEDFQDKFHKQPYFCLPHYRRLLALGSQKLNKKRMKDLATDCEKIVKPYMDKLTEDISWFCKKFDYRYENEPWYDSKDAVERAMKFLRSDVHATEKKKAGN